MRSQTNPRYTRGVLLQQFARPFVERGGSIEPVLHRNGIPDAALRDPKRLVEASAFYAALEDMADALKDPYFGATVARNAAFEGVPSLRAAASTAMTLGDFLIGAILDVDLQFDNVAYDLRVQPGSGGLSGPADATVGAADTSNRRGRRCLLHDGNGAVPGGVLRPREAARLGPFVRRCAKRPSARAGPRAKQGCGIVHQLSARLAEGAISA